MQTNKQTNNQQQAAARQNCVFVVKRQTNAEQFKIDMRVKCCQSKRQCRQQRFATNTGNNNSRASTGTGTIACSNINDTRRRQRQHCARLCTSAYFGTLSVLIASSRIVLLAPIIKRATDGYRTHTLLSICATLTIVSVGAAAPFLVRTHITVYGVSDIETDDRFKHIALVSLCSDYSVSLLMLAIQTWRRQRLASFLNDFSEIIADLRRIERHFINWRYLLILWLRVAHCLYGFSMNLPFLIRHSGELDASSLFACIVTLVIEQLSRIFALNTMAVLLLFTACYAQLQNSLKHSKMPPSLSSPPEHSILMQQLYELENALQALLQRYVRTFDLSIFLLLSGEFINLLANLYGLVYHTVDTGGIYPNLIAYNLSLAIDLYSLVFCAHLCNQQRDRTKLAFLNRDCDLQAQCTRSLTHSHPFWPLNVRISILGLFCLDHEFWLFLVSYAVNFIVIIIQFAIEESDKH